MFPWSMAFFTLALIASAVGRGAPPDSVVLTVATIAFVLAFILFAVTLILSPFADEQRGGGKGRVGRGSLDYRRSPR